MYGRKWASLRPTPSKPRDEAQAWGHLQRLLAHRPRTVAELRERLTRRGFSPAVVERVVSQATEEGLVDDRAFARLYAEDRLLSRPCSRRLLVEELRERGVEAQLAAEAARTAFPDLSEEDLARRALAGRLPLWRGLAREVAECRAGSFLLRRGFSLAVARAILEEALETWTSE